MNLYEGLPQGFAIGALTVTVEHGALFWLRLSHRLEDADEARAWELLESAVTGIKRGADEIPPHALSTAQARSLFERLLWFMHGGKEDRQQAEAKHGGEKLLCYAQDLDAIYAAFMQAYGLDLYAETGDGYLIETLHWWKFLALMHNLPDGSRLVDYYLYYRSTDLSRLPNKTEADRKYKQSVAEVKKAVSLGRKESPRGRTEWGPAARLKELKAQKENPAETASGACARRKINVIKKEPYPRSKGCIHHSAKAS